MTYKELDKYGFTSPSWKKGLIIGIITLLCSAIAWQALTTVPKSTYNDVKSNNATLLEQLRVCNDETKRYLMYGVPKLEQVVKKQDTLEHAVKQNAEVYNNTKNELKNEASKH